MSNLKNLKREKKETYKVLILLYFVIITSLCAYGQEIPLEKQEMRLIGELPGHIDVKFRVVKCENSNQNQVFILLHNESERYGESRDTTSNFNIVILNYKNGESFKKNITISTSIGQIITPDCENNSPLKINLPISYTPSAIAAYLINDEN